ncbi:MAG: nitrilase-related carbon-nitrogen hydrolase [Phycisphaerales bacterium]|nr:nitrilase-related carbon-nitrogen hydrolase [Phycisphaerales bacterium]
MSHQSLSISIVQSNLVWGDISKNLALFSQKLSSINPGDTDVILLPETFSTGFLVKESSVLAEDMQGPTISWLKQMAQQKQAVMVGSIFVKEGTSFFNRLLWVEPDATIRYYNKRHLFTIADEHKYLTAGEERMIWSFKGFTFLPTICYDIRFPVSIRQQVQKGLYDIIICVANWPERRNYAWRSLLIARAIENQSWVVAVNRIGKDGYDIDHCGGSMIINPNGKVVAEHLNKETIDSITLSLPDIQSLRQKFPFLENDDKFEIK